jgi:hypothetical protein
MGIQSEYEVREEEDKIKNELKEIRHYKDLLLV